MNMPQDPILLMSLANTYLRDRYADLDALCADLGWERETVCARLESAGFTYMPQQNQFR